MDESGLGKSDLVYFSQAVKSGKLPKLKELCLGGNDLSSIEQELGDAISKLTSLGQLRLNKCKMSLSASAAVLKALSNCPFLECLYLEGSTLTDCMVHFLGDNSPGFPRLRELSVHNTKLSEDDFICMRRALYYGKLPVLNSLCLSGTTTTHSIVDDFLNVCGGALKMLVLTRKLTSCIKFLLNPDDNFTIPQLQTLFIMGRLICKFDLTSLAQAVESDKLPNLETLYFKGINLFLLEQDVKNLIQSCVAQYKRRKLTLGILENMCMSAEFKAEMQSLCQGTNVKLELSSTVSGFGMIYGDL